MDEPGSEQHTKAGASTGADPAPDLAEALRQIGAAGREGASAAGDAAKALRLLISADLSLARSALGRVLAFTGVAVAFGGSAWLLLMALVAALLHDLRGWSWALSLGACAALSVAITAVGIWGALHYFEYTRMRATRRQLARLGIGELSDFMPPAGSEQSAREASLPKEPVKKGLGIDVTPP